MQNLSAAERLALLELLEATAPKQAAPTVSQIQPVERSGPLPLSFAQWRLWFLDQLGIPGAVYHIPTRLRLRGELDRDALVRALDRIVARHEALRTTFATVDGEAVQRIAPAEESPLELAEHDLRGYPEAGAELRRLVLEEAETLFNLERGPLIRGSLIRTADDDQVLLITMHHIVSDGWSMGVFARELLSPVRELRLKRLARQPLALPHRVVRVLDGKPLKRRLHAARECFVERAQLADEDARRPAVRDDVVHREEQRMLPAAQPQQGRAQQRPSRQVEGEPRLGVHQAPRLGLALRLAEPGQVNQRD